MAENKKYLSGDRRQSSRLQRKAPASIQINRSTDWNVAIPLLSPLITSPDSSDLTAAIKSCSNSSSKKDEAREAEKPQAVVFKKWQHPAAPFSYEPAPFLQFVCTGSADR